MLGHRLWGMAGCRSGPPAVLSNLGGSFVLERVKQMVGFYRIFIIKIRGGGVCTEGNAITKNEVNISVPLGFTALPERSNTGYMKDYDG